MQVGNQTAIPTLWISYEYTALNKRTGNRLNFIHNHSNCDLNNQDHMLKYIEAE